MVGPSRRALLLTGAALLLLVAVPPRPASGAREAAGGTWLRLRRLTEPGAVCVDGSPAAYYHTDEAGTGGEPDDSGQDGHQTDNSTSGGPAARGVVIYLEGGGYCHEVAACRWRCQVAPALCSSTHYAVSKQVHGILSSDPEENPGFHDYYKVDVPYCTGDMYVGRSPPGRGAGLLTFRGRRVLDAVMADLTARGRLGGDVILSGSSAGGAGVAFNCEHVRRVLGRRVRRVWCVVDAAFFYPAHQPLHNTSACDDIDRVLRAAASLWHAPEVSSFRLHAAWWRSLRPPLLLGSARYDRFGLESYCADVRAQGDLAAWGGGALAMARRLVRRDPRVSLFMPACLAHMMLHTRHGFSTLRVGPGRLTYGETLALWVRGGDPVHVFDTCEAKADDLFCNPQCHLSLDAIPDW